MTRRAGVAPTPGRWCGREASMPGRWRARASMPGRWRVRGLLCQAGGKATTSLQSTLLCRALSFAEHASLQSTLLCRAFLPLSSDPRRAHVCIKQYRVKRMNQQQRERGKREVRMPQKMPRLEIKRNTTPTSKQKPNSDTEEASHR